MSDTTATVFIGLGANLPSYEGDPRHTLEAATRELASLSTVPVRCSSFWESDPIDCPPGSPRYVNAVCMISPPETETPESLLERLQAIEARFGRRRSGIVNESRVLDLDLLAWGESVMNTPELTLPHPRAHRRAFVLAPWAELAPDFRLPGIDRQVADLLYEVGQDDVSIISG